jgi:MSHA biogenesis protein MshJ
MKALWKRYAERVDAMTLRERVMIFAAMALLLAAFVYSLFIDAEFAKGKRLALEIAQRQAEMKSMQDEMVKLVRGRDDPERASRERIAQLRMQLAAVETKIAAEERKFTAASQMRKVVEELLARNRSVRLIDLKTLPVTSIAESRAGEPAPPSAEAKAPSSAERLIYRHGLELTVSGGYLDLLAYLAELERLPTQLYWSDVELNASAYPTIRMKLIVFTLSIDRAWMSV